MAGRHEGCASIGCLGICFLALVVAIGTCGGSGEGTGSGYVPADPPSYSAPAAVPAVVEDARPPGAPRELHVGPRGGCYYISDSGSKQYVDRSACSGISAPAAREPLLAPFSGSAAPTRRSGGGRQLHVGPRGGCYYINSRGNKTYVDRSECS